VVLYIIDGFNCVTGFLEGVLLHKLTQVLFNLPIEPPSSARTLLVVIGPTTTNLCRPDCKFASAVR